MGSAVKQFLKNIGYQLWTMLKFRLLCQVLLVVLFICFSGYWLLYASSQGDNTTIISSARQTPHYFTENHPRVLVQHADMYTECIGVAIAANLYPNFDSVMQMNKVENCDGLREFLNAPTKTPLAVYGRYWQGYQTIMRPLLLFFSYDKTRIIVGVVSLLLTICFFYMLAIRAGKLTAFLVFLAFCMTMRDSVFCLVTYAVQYWVVIGSALVVMRIYAERIKSLPFLFAIIGGLDAYFTFLNLPSLSLSIPLLCWFLCELSGEVNSEKLLARAILCCATWMMSLVLVWNSKWVLLRYVQGNWDFLSAAVERYSIGSCWPFEAPILCFLKTQFIALFMIVAVLYWIKKRSNKVNLPKVWCLLFPAALPLLWIELVMPGHTMHHPRMDAFALWPSLAVILLLLLSPYQKKR